MTRSLVRWTASAVVMAALGACAPHEIDFVASRTPAPRPAEPSPGNSRLPVPPPGEVRAATLADGWPVWVVRHASGDVTVISAVRSRPRARQPSPLPDADLVTWIGGTR